MSGLTVQTVQIPGFPWPATLGVPGGLNRVYTQLLTRTGASDSSESKIELLTGPQPRKCPAPFLHTLVFHEPWSFLLCRIHSHYQALFLTWAITELPNLSPCNKPPHEQSSSYRALPHSGLRSGSPSSSGSDSKPLKSDL